MGVKLTVPYKTVGNFDFASAFAKIENTPTTPFKAAQMRKTVKAVKDMKEKMHAEYTEAIINKFSQKNEDGSVKVDPEAPGNFLPMEGDTIMEDIKQASIAFELREYTFEDITPFNPTLISDIKVSPKEIEALGPFFSEEAGPGVPTL